MERENLILVHSFPTNSILLSGLIEYLNDFFNVYFIDLPGFTKKVPPLSEISFDGYYEFVERKIEEFNLESYLVSGVSFGFLMVNNVQHDRRCKGIIAMAPYIGPRSLRMNLLKKILYTTFIKSVCFFKLYSLVWGSDVLREYLPKLRHYPPGTVDVMLDQIDGRTFFETANQLLGDRNEYSFQDFPYVLIANKDDRTVNFDYIHRTLAENVEKLLVVNTTLAHYPPEMTKEYFREKIPGEDVNRIISFLSGQ